MNLQANALPTLAAATTSLQALANGESTDAQNVLVQAFQPRTKICCF